MKRNKKYVENFCENLRIKWCSADKTFNLLLQKLSQEIPFSSKQVDMIHYYYLLYNIGWNADLFTLEPSLKKMYKGFSGFVFVLGRQLCYSMY